jgi:hypothetical protein
MIDTFLTPDILYKNINVTKIIGKCNIKPSYYCEIMKQEKNKSLIRPLNSNSEYWMDNKSLIILK